MSEILYCIEDERGNVLARNIHRDVALILIRSFIGTSYYEKYTIRRQKEA